VSLKVFMFKNEIPAGTFVHYNDDFFDNHTELMDTELCRAVLRKIDKAEYVSPVTFYGRTANYGSLRKDYLSSGTKTLLNIISHPDKCFDVCECGDNVLSFLPELNNGMVFWPIPVLIDVDRPCNIIVGKRHFTTVADFTEGVRAIYDENNQYK